MYIASWNALIRAYEEKYNPESDILKLYPDESVRVKEQFDFILANATNSIVCLQECSGKLVSLLEEFFVNRKFTLFKECISEEFDEYLITIAPSTFRKEKSFPFDGAHGLLIVSNNQTRIINCHLKPQKLAKVNILNYFKFYTSDKRLVICGDFNEKHQFVSKGLRSRFVVPKFGLTYRKKQIDYIMFENRGHPKVENHLQIIKKRTVISPLSDHRMILAEFDLT
jgi:exonuclease III